MNAVMNRRRGNQDLRAISLDMEDLRNDQPGNDVSQARTVQELLQRAGMNWTAKMAKVQFAPELAGDDPTDTRIRQLNEVSDRRVIYRNDTGLDLGVTSDHYKMFQPEDVGVFFQDLCDRHGFTMDRAGVFKGGRVIFARAKVGKALRIHGNDVVEGECQLVTSFDGSLATMIRFGTKRLICLNGMTVGEDIVPVVRVSHRSLVNQAEVKIKLGLEGVFEKFEEQAEILADTAVNNRQAIEFFMQVYHDMKLEQMVDAQQNAKDKMDATVARLAQHFIASPGAQLASAKNTAWGLVNAVTYDVDHVINARSAENRTFSSLFGAGEKLKNRAWELARSMAKAA
jgi:phage/plasmid-like protein (TIGR03299 family)